jgi:8-oxo-dGTP pyrophosphatase MutT (NUDIX family)
LHPRSADPFRPYCAVQLVLLRDEHVLLARRANTGFEDGNYGLVAGHIEGDEPARAAMAREAFEEAGIRIDPDALQLSLTMHRHAPDREYIDLFFVARDWLGEPTVGERDKCDRLEWFALGSLPPNTIPYIGYAIDCIRAGAAYCETGWP